MKNWIAFTTALVFAFVAYYTLFFITAPLIVFFSMLLEKTRVVGFSIFIPGVIYFLGMYIYLMKGWVGKRIKKMFRNTISIA